MEQLANATLGAKVRGSNMFQQGMLLMGGGVGGVWGGGGVYKKKA